MNRIIKSTILLTVLLSSQTIFYGEKIIETSRSAIWVSDNSDYDHPEKLYKEYYNVDRDILPQDLLGDWTIPERGVETYGNVYSAWDGHYPWKVPSEALFAVETSYFEYDESTNRHQDSVYWHEKYSNWFDFVPDNGGYYWDGDSWEEFNLRYVEPSDTEIVERTPMRGIIPFWEYTSQFNDYVMSETNNGTIASDNLYYESGYASYIDEYINSTESKFPAIYKYLEDPSLLYDIFITNEDSVEWILPDDYQLVKYDDLTSAFVGVDGDWKLSSFMQYIYDFVIWNWNTNVYPYKGDIAYYDQLKEITPYDITIEVLPWDSTYDRVSLDGAGFNSPEAGFESSWGNVNIKDFHFSDIGVSNQGANVDGTDAPWSDDIAKWNQFVSLSFTTTGIYGELQKISPKYRWEKTNKSLSLYDWREDHFEMFNPINQQMNVNVIPTEINFDGLQTRYEETLTSIKANDENVLYQESTFAEFKSLFENWLINSETGINKYFVDFYSDCHVNDYYNNYGGDGTAFLGHNRFQTGIYPIEDIRLDNLIITYTDQDGNALTDKTQLGTIDSVEMTIEYNTESDTAKLFNATSAIATNLSFDTTSLESNYIAPPTNDDGGISPLIIIIIVLLVMTVVGAIVAVMLLKNKK